LVIAPGLFVIISGSSYRAQFDTYKTLAESAEEAV
jgi:hypothetical protein